MLRLFAAIEVPLLHRNRLALLKSPLAGAKWVEPADMHISLRFAGDIDNRTADDFAGFLDGIEASPFEVGFTEVAAFGGREPRVIYAGVDGGTALSALQQGVERAARSAGLAPEPKSSFTPHVTLARLNGTRPEAAARYLGQCPPLVLPPFPVERFHLYSARPKVGGGPYVIEATFELGG